MSSSVFRINGNGKEDTDARPAGMCRRGVLLINLGTPEGPDVQSTRRYLAEFLSDPEVIHLPGGLRWLNRPLGQLIAWLRAPRSAQMYQRIWTERGSPLGSISEEQAWLLESVLPDGWRVFHAMRYGKPTIAETVGLIEAAGVEELVVVPMYPQFSGPTTGTALRELYRILERGHHRINVTTRNTWYDDGGYVHAQAKLIEEYATRHGLSHNDTFLLFSAHGLPVSYVERGDPYPVHLARTVDLVRERLGWPGEKSGLAYQSRIGPARWLKPHTDETLARLALDGATRVLVCPISFTTDCLETLEEIDVRYRERFEQAGGELYLCPALNTFGEFIEALKQLVLRGSRPVAYRRARSRPLLDRGPEPAAALPNVDSLVMVGVSLPGRVGGGRGAQLVHCDAEDFRDARKPQYEIPQSLRRICRDGRVREAFVWNTCHRFEFYGWPVGDAVEGNGCIVARVREHLFNGNSPKDLPVNVLCGADAWQHLMRTAGGLNSGLPGDRDVVDQLRQAHNVAQRAGTAGPLTRRLISEVIDLERALRSETPWGRFNPGYCLAAISQIVESSGLDLSEGRSLVIGGSSTSRSVLATLIERFEVPSRKLTLAYRGHGGGQIKLLRKAIRNGRRLRVQSYGEPQVIRALADADIIFFGIDRDEPVLDVEQIRDVRDFSSRPLTVIDFNTFGSTTGLERLEDVSLLGAGDLDNAVAAYADAMCAAAKFTEAVEAAEQWIIEHAPRFAGTPSRPQRCHGLVGEAAKDVTRFNATHIEERWPRCVRCAVNRLASDTLVAGSCLS